MTVIRTELATPRAWWNKLDQEFHFTLDAAADHHHFMCQPYMTEEVDALTRPWTGTVWCSPPWRKPDIGTWVDKGYRSTRLGKAETVVMLLPVRTDTDWWHQFVLLADEIRFIRGTLQWVAFDPRVESIETEPHFLAIFKPRGQPLTHPIETRLRSYPA